MNQRKEKQSVSLTLDVEIVQKLRALAEEEYRSLSQCTNLILRRYLQESGSANARQAAACPECRTGAAGEEGQR